jgi:hypothetical protein
MAKRETMDTGQSVFSLLLRRLFIYLAAVAVAYFLAVASATHSVVDNLDTLGVPIGFGEQLAMTRQDLVGMAAMFLPMVAFAMLCAFMAAALLCRWAAHWRVPIYVLAGAVGLVAIHLMLNLAFQITPVAVARTAGGLTLQALAGAVGGLTYIILRRSRFSG